MPKHGELKQINIDVGRRVRLCRETQGMTREHLAEIVGITPRFLADVERGSTGLSITTLTRLCDALRVPADVLLFDKSASKEVLIDELASILNDMDADRVAVLLEIIRLQTKLIK